MDAEAIFQSQVHLRNMLLERRQAISYPPARDLAAHLLVSLDDPIRCWHTALQWLQKALDVERADGGYASSRDLVYCPGQYEIARSDEAILTLRGITIDNTARFMSDIWGAESPLVLHEIEQERRIDARLREDLLKRGVKRKIVSVLTDSGHPIGLLCVDQIRSKLSWSASRQYVLFTVCREILSPVLATIENLFGLSRRTVVDLCNLTAAERRVARLVAVGQSYKEIARTLGRSPFTVDHHLRNIRKKLGVRSHSKLVGVLGRQNILRNDGPD